MALGEILLSGQQSRATEMYQILKDAILSGRLHPNERLIEEQIAESAKVSRTPVREAIRKLETEGLVRQTSLGVVVAEVTLNELREFCQVREVLESLACRLAAESRSRLDLITLEYTNAQYATELAAGDTEAMIVLNRTFHESIWRLANNSYLASTLGELRSRIDGLQPSTTLDSIALHAEAYEEHSAIVRAIAARDADRAESVALGHFSKAMGRRLAKAVANQMP